MSQNSLRSLVEHTFGQLARDIAYHGLSEPHGNNQFGRDVVNYDKPFAYYRPVDIGGSEGYQYCPIDRLDHHRDTNGIRWPGQITFYNLHVTGIAEVDPQDIDITTVPGSQKTVTVDEYVNDGPTIFTRQVESEQERTSETEHSFRGNCCGRISESNHAQSWHEFQGC